MANKNKSKGSYHERKIVDWLQSLGLKAKKQPLSGSLGGEYRGDIKVTIKDLELIAEVKYRDTSGFPSPFSVLEGRDIAVYKRRRGTPQTLVIMSGEVFANLLSENNDDPTEHTNPSPPKNR